MVIGPFHFDAPVWLILAPICWALAILIARRSLQGLGRVTQYVSLGIRLLLIGLIVVVLAEPNWRDESRDVAVILVNDTSASMSTDRQEQIGVFADTLASAKETSDRLGAVSASGSARVRTLPQQKFRDGLGVTEWVEVDREATDLAAGLRMALAIAPKDAAARILLFTDGNETSGSLLEAAQAAKVAGIPVDVLPAPFEASREIIVDDLIAPATARQGQTANLRVVFTSTAPASGNLTMSVNGVPIDLDPATDGVDPKRLELPEGRYVTTIPVTMLFDGQQLYEMEFQPDDPAMDTNRRNNRALAVTFVSGEGKVLFYANNESTYLPLLRTMREAGIGIEFRSPAEAHESLLDLQEFDAIVLANVGADQFNRRQQEELARFVHDIGGGLVMLGGENSFGAGAWIGTPVADVLPLKLDPPQRRELPQGALVLILHSVEMANGTYWGKEVARAAVDTLTRLDLVGVLEYAGGLTPDGVVWRYRIQEKGDGAALNQAINSLAFGDMPDFDATMRKAHAGLTSPPASGAGQKHVIVISDGDPSGPAQSILNRFVADKITISTVAVFPHSWGNQNQDLMKMRRIAETTGGRYYAVTNQNQVASLPQIFMKEAQVVKRTLIWEGEPIAPQIVNMAAEPMRGIRTLPPVSGYIVTAEREGLATITAEIPGSEHKDPLAAQWQHGLGRAVAFTSDATTRWSAAWSDWNQYQAFWEQHIRWAMRPTGSANMKVVTQSRGDTTKIVVTARDDAGDSLNGVNFTGSVIDPDLATQRVELRQTGPGRYEGEFDSSKPGAYALSYRYTAAGDDGTVDRGSVQAAVTRPFADEYRAIRDNLPLLRQVMELTGGQELTLGDPDAETVFTRTGLTMPVSLQPIWLPLALAALVLFLADVGVRRVRIDIPAILRSARSITSREKQQSGEPLGALKSARSRARERMDERGGAPAKDVAKRKFEAEPGAKSPSSPLTERKKPIEDRTKKPAEPESDAQDGEEQGMSRLLQAKRRARDSMGRKDQEEES